ncbi:MAG: SDR family oxidoreductase [Bacteroidetes bacterium]|nr:MAG: SDR family oxidoreductase [Bacteroidota bacterium]TAG89360.1 MAG: SDR family oxidoreductase [Bacteroidota bacterium]
MKKLQNKIAIITGGAQGIGAGIVSRFAHEGAIVIIWDLQTEKAKTLASTLKASGSKCEVMEGVDITSLASVENAAKIVFEKYGQIDIIVNNAGIVRDASFLKMTEDQWNQVINVNLTGVFNCTKAITPYMVQNQYGRILNISSISGVYGNFGQTNYIAAKAAVAAMVKGWGRELGKYNITANAVAPGPIDTEMLATVPDDIRDQMKMRVPVKRLGKPEDIAVAALFFCSEEASFVTGQTLVVDGGNMLGG